MAAALGDNLDDIAGLAAAGACAFKSFRTRTLVGREREFKGICCPDLGRLLPGAAGRGRHGPGRRRARRRCLAHRSLERGRARAGGERPRSHGQARPPIVEEACVAQCLALARAAGARLHIVHCSSPHSVDMIAEARRRGQAVTVETCPQYLFVTEDLFDAHGPYAKTNPPLQRRTGGWPAGAPAAGRDRLCMQRSPSFLASEKEPHWNDMWAAPPGAPKLEALVLLMPTAVVDGRLSLAQMAALTSTNAARIFKVSAQGCGRGWVGCGLHPGRSARGEPHRCQPVAQSAGAARMWNGLPVKRDQLRCDDRARAGWLRGAMRWSARLVGGGSAPGQPATSARPA